MESTTRDMVEVRTLLRRKYNDLKTYFAQADAKRDEFLAQRLSEAIQNDDDAESNDANITATYLCHSPKNGASTPSSLVRYNHTFAYCLALPSKW